MYYKASYDNTVKIITGASVLLALGLLYVNPIPSVVLAVLILFCYGLSPRGYSIENGNLIIHKPFKNKVIPLSEILSAWMLDPDELRFSIRVFGVGGLFGYYGIFNSPKSIGRATWYRTQRINPLLVTLKNGDKIVLSPDDPVLAAELNFKS